MGQKVHGTVIVGGRWHQKMPAVRAGCTSGAVHVHKACPGSGYGHRSLSVETTTGALQVFLAAFVVSSLLILC